MNVQRAIQIAMDEIDNVSHSLSLPEYLRFLEELANNIRVRTAATRENIQNQIRAQQKEFCTRCGEELRPSEAAWLELSNTDNRYYMPNFIPEGHVSQGCFVFGQGCVRTVLKNGGNCVKIRDAKR